MRSCSIVLTAWTAILCTADVGPCQERPVPEKVQRDVVYGRRDGLALTMDVYLPKKPNGVALIGIVSGNFRSSPDKASPFKDEFLKRGYTVFSVVPSSSPRFTVREMHEDVCRAVRFVRYSAKKYAIDPKRIGAGGMSSGGLLGLLAATSPKPANFLTLDPVDWEESTIQATCNFFPPTDFFNYGKPGVELVDLKNHEPRFRAAFDFHIFDAKEGMYQRITDKNKVRAIYREISPIYHVTKKTAPTLLIHGDQDKLVPIQQSRTFIRKLDETKVSACLIEREGAGHGWLTILNDLSLMANWYDEHLLKAK